MRTSATIDSMQNPYTGIAKTTGAVAGTIAQSLLSAAHVDPMTSTAAGAAISATVEDLFDRTLSARERARVETVVSLAREFYGERYMRGDNLREDDFIAGDSSDFSQTIDGVLISAQREHEAKKLRFLAHLVANLAFMPEVDSTTANWCIRTASDLSWTQYVLLALSGENELDHERVRISAGRGETHNLAEWSAWGEYENLQERTLVSTRENAYQTWANATPPPRMPWVPTTGGELLIKILSLDLMPMAERDRVYSHLAAGAASLTRRWIPQPSNEPG